jgi:hypothetical protein
MHRIVCLGSALILSAISSFAFAQAPTGELRAACGVDVKKLCTGVAPGGGRLIKCLTEHKDDVSEPCRKALKI